MADDDDDAAITESERVRALTDKGLEEKLHNTINARRGKKSTNLIRISGISLNCCVAKKFMEKVEFWIEETKNSIKMSQICDKEVSPMDSVSMVASKTLASNKSGSGVTSVSKRSSTSTASSARLKEEANRAALLAKAAAVKERQALEMKEAQLKAEMEKLEIETALAMSDAKIKVYQDCEERQHYASQSVVTKSVPKLELYEQDEYSVSSKYGKMSSRREAVQSSVPLSVRPKKTSTLKERSTQDNESSCRNIDTVELQRVMQRQTDITEMLAKSQRQSSLPQRDVPLFHGDPLEFRSFMKAFEHAVESRAASNTDKLYFLEQYTRGEPRDLVKSCQHMPDHRGYAEAMKLLHERFGNELKIATALMQKAFKWPEIKSEDGKSLSTFSLFLVTCRNVMEDIEYMDELDNPTNMRIIISKLPYKLRERWRAHAYEYEEHSRKRAKFIQLVEFVDRQAKVISNPLFGDLDVLASDKKHSNKSLQGSKLKKEGKRGSSFVTGVKQKEWILLWMFSERTLKQRKHPCMLHITAQDTAHGKVMEKVDETETVNTLPATVNHETSACTGAGDNCVLAIVPVKIKSKKSDKTVEVYAFMDPGSSATFCTESLARRLNVQGRKVDMMLSTMNSKKQVESYVLTDLEVSGLEENTFVELSKVFTQKSIPVSMENIPQQHDVDKWPYLSEVKLPQIDAGVEILIGNKEYKLLEPWQVNNSKHNGPYAVKTVLGWILNGPLREPVEESMYDNKQASVTVNRISIESVEQMLIQQYNHDFPERNCDDKAELSQEDYQFLDSVSNSLQFTDNHYYIGLPLKKAVIQMPNNRSAAMQRALNLKKKFKKNRSFHDEYSNFMNDMFEKGHAVKVPTPHLS
ncbi:G2 and S phase-expressed protein 1 [Labeo rohita]|uniref:G2 and S phase-expressed protein 1 n=1 Tax=Labeo rohita TaxID=84645 RepID=A0ABQ8MGM0_LABRO|nr:G2 and S phase-expressed protein 1 [Labeo rohita]